MAFSGSRMRTERQPLAISSTWMRMGRNGGYNSSRRASETIPLRDMNRMNFAISAMPTPCLVLLLQSSQCGRSVTSMRTVQQWFDEYAESHSNPRNEVLHFICVPAIVVTVIGFLWAIPVPEAAAAVSPWLNFATLAVAVGIVYYFTLSWRLGLGAAAVLVAMLFIVRWLDTLAWPLWLTCLAVFVIG